MSVPRAFAVLVLAAAAATAAAAAEESIEQRQAQLTRPIDELCRWTGLRRPQPPKIDRIVPADSGYVAYLDLIVDGATKQYRISLDSQQHISRFMPEHFAFG